MTLSFHDVVSDPAQRPAAVQALKEIPDVFSIERCPRGRDMMPAVITPSLMWLTEHVYPHLDQVPGLNPATIRRPLRQVLDSGAVTIRCETSHRAAGFPVVGERFCRLPAAEHEDAAAALRTMSTLRLCTSLTGPANFSFLMWLRSPADIMTVEQRISARIPQLEVLESVVITEIPKRVGRVLDVDGRSTGQVVLPGPAWG